MIRAALILVASLPGTLWAQQKPRPAKHLLRYAFRVGEEGRFQMRVDLHQGIEKSERKHTSTVIRDMSWRVLSTDGEWSVVELVQGRLRLRASGRNRATFDSDRMGVAALPGSWAYLHLPRPVRFRVNTRGVVDDKNITNAERKSRSLLDLRTVVRELPPLPVDKHSRWRATSKWRVLGTARESVEVHHQLVSVNRRKVTLAYEVQLPKRILGLDAKTKEASGNVVFDLGKFVPDHVDQTIVMELSGGGIAQHCRELRFRIGPPGSLEEDVPMVGGGK